MSARIRQWPLRGSQRRPGGLVAGAALFSDVITGVNAAGNDTSPVMDFKEHGDVGVMNPKQRDTLDLTRTVDGVSMTLDTTDLAALELSATRPGNF